MKYRIFWTMGGNEFGYNCQDKYDLDEQIAACKEMGWAYRIEEY